MPHLLCLTSGKLHVVTEFCPGGALRDILIKSRVHRSSEDKQKYVINLASTLHEKDLLKIAAEISSGMAHLSSQKVVILFDIFLYIFIKQIRFWD